MLNDLKSNLDTNIKDVHSSQKYISRLENRMLDTDSKTRDNHREVLEANNKLDDKVSKNHDQLVE